MVSLDLLGLQEVSCMDTLSIAVHNGLPVPLMFMYIYKAAAYQVMG